MLTPPEIHELDEFCEQHKISGMKQLVQKENNEDAVVVSAPGGLKDQPIIFQIYVNH